MKAKESITQYKFKPGLPLEFEILSIKDLYKKNKKLLTLPHRTDFYHIIWIESGKTVHLVDFNPVYLQKNSILFIGKGKVHFFDSVEKCDGKIILFTDNFFCKNETDINFLNSTILFNDFLETTALKLDGIQESLSKILALIQSEIKNPAHPSQRDIIKNYLHNFLLLSDDAKRKQGFKEIPKGADRDYALLFISHVNENFAAIKSVKIYADMIHISEKRLNRATARVFGKSPKEVINDRVLLEARRLLVHTNQSIKEIGFTLGFVEPTNFIKYFKQQSNQTPSEFRQSHLS